MRPFFLFAAVLSSASAQAADPDFRASWRELTCGDDVIQASAKARAAPACGARKVGWTSVQYRPVGAQGCDVWLAVTCEGTITSSFTGPGHPTAPTLYTDDTWGGTMLVLSPGKRNLADVPMRDGDDTWNDKTSAVRVPPGWTVRLCSEPDGNGKCTDLTAEHPKLGNTYVGNDSASSVEVVKGTLSPLLACPRVFENDNYGGMYLDVCHDVASWVGTPWNDKISSIMLPPGWKVRACADADHGGTCTELLGDVWALRDTPVGSDRISSLKIVARGK